MRILSSGKFLSSHIGENRNDRRYSRRFRNRRSKSYFVMPNEAIELYRNRVISAVDVAVYSALCSLRREHDGVRLSQRKIAFMCNIKSVKTVAASAERLYKCGLIVNIITPVVKQMKKYETSIYQLKPLSENSGFFFAPRLIFLHTRITPKMFAVYFFMCRACSVEYGKSWNSYNDICEKLGFGKGQRSEVVKLIGSLAECGLLKKTVRRIKGVFVDNIYRIAGFEDIIFLSAKVGGDFTYNVLTKKVAKTRAIPQDGLCSSVGVLDDYAFSRHYGGYRTERKILGGNPQYCQLAFECG